MISVYSITFVVFLFEGSVIPTESFEVIRGEKDKFSNPLCSEGSGDYESPCQESSCVKLYARCDTSTDCKYCTCEGDKRTYYRSECVEDQDTLGNSGCKLFFYNYSWYTQPGTCAKNCLSERIPVPSGSAGILELKWRETKYMRNSNSWKSVKGRKKDFPIKKRTSAIKIIKKNVNALKAWNGSLLKLAFTYTGGRHADKIKRGCVILKFYTLQQQVKTTRDLRSGSSSSTTVAISVSIALFVLILLIVFGLLTLYRRRKRNQQQPANRTEMQSRKQRIIHEDPSPMYEDLKVDERQIDTEEGYHSLLNRTENPSDTAEHVYDYIDTGEQKMKDPGSNEDEYSYASNDEVAQDFAALPQPSAPDSSVYHTLEEPEAAENPTPTHDGSSDPLDQESKNPVYAILDESNVESGEAREVEPEKDPSEEFRAPPEDNDPYHHVLDSSRIEKSV